MREWLKSLDQDDRRVIGTDILAVQKGWHWGCRYAARSGKGYGRCARYYRAWRIARAIFAFDAGEIVLLNGFIKKTQKTPPDEIALAMKRLKETAA